MKPRSSTPQVASADLSGISVATCAEAGGICLSQHCADDPAVGVTCYCEAKGAWSDAIECAVDHVHIVRVVDRSTNTSAFYEYERTPCVELTFYSDARMVSLRRGATDTLQTTPEGAHQPGGGARVEEMAGMVWAAPGGG